MKSQGVMFHLHVFGKTVTELIWTKICFPADVQDTDISSKFQNEVLNFLGVTILQGSDFGFSCWIFVLLLLVMYFRTDLCDVV